METALCATLESTFTPLPQHAQNASQENFRAQTIRWVPPAKTANLANAPLEMTRVSAWRAHPASRCWLMDQTRVMRAALVGIRLCLLRLAAKHASQASTGLCWLRIILTIFSTPWSLSPTWPHVKRSATTSLIANATDMKVVQPKNASCTILCIATQTMFPQTARPIVSLVL